MAFSPRNPKQKTIQARPLAAGFMHPFSIWKGAKTFTCESSIGQIKMIA